MQYLKNLLWTQPASKQSWETLSSAEAEAEIKRLLDSKDFIPLFMQIDGKYIDQRVPISEELQIRLLKEVPGWAIRQGLYYGEKTVYPESVLIACLECRDSEEWIKNPAILTKQAKQTSFIIKALGKYPEEVINHPELMFKVDHEVFKSEEFALAVSKVGTDILFEQDEDGDTFLFNRWLDKESVTKLLQAVGKSDFCRLVLTKNKAGEHFAYNYTLSPETVVAVIDALPIESQKSFVSTSSKRGRLFINTINGGSKEVASKKLYTGRVTRSSKK